MRILFGIRNALVIGNGGNMDQNTFPTAQEARDRAQSTKRRELGVSVTAINDKLRSMIHGALESGLSSITLQVPPSIDDTTFFALKKAFVALGYRVRLQREMGVFATNLVREPKASISLSW